jgi:hypothetical protein
MDAGNHLSIVHTTDERQGFKKTGLYGWLLCEIGSERKLLDKSIYFSTCGIKKLKPFALL